jgi:hypothetical protein
MYRAIERSSRPRKTVTSDVAEARTIIPMTAATIRMWNSASSIPRRRRYECETATVRMPSTAKRISKNSANLSPVAKL